MDFIVQQKERTMTSITILSSPINVTKMSKKERIQLLKEWRSKINIEELDRNQVNILAYLVVLTDLMEIL